MNKRKIKGIVPVISILLLLILIVFVSIFLGNWYGSVEDSLVVTSSKFQNLNSDKIIINTLTPNALNIINHGEEIISVDKLMLNSVVCNINFDLEVGFNEVSLDSCEGNIVGNVIEVLLIAQNDIIKRIYIPNLINGYKDPFIQKLNFIYSGNQLNLPDGFDEIQLFTVVGDYLYGVNSNQSLVVYDFSNKDSPIELGSYQNSSLLNMSIIEVHGDYAYTFSDDYFSIFDVSDKNNLILLDSFATNINVLMTNFKFSENQDYLFYNFVSEVKIINISDKTNILEINSIPGEGMNFDIEYDSENKYLYVSIFGSGNYINIYDVGDVNNYILLTNYSTNPNLVTNLLIDNNILYFTSILQTGETFERGDFRVFNVSDIYNFDELLVIENLTLRAYNFIQETIYKKSDDLIYFLNTEISDLEVDMFNFQGKHNLITLNISDLNNIEIETYPIKSLNIFDLMFALPLKIADEFLYKTSMNFFTEKMIIRSYDLSNLENIEEKNYVSLSSSEFLGSTNVYKKNLYVSPLSVFSLMSGVSELNTYEIKSNKDLIKTREDTSGGITFIMGVDDDYIYTYEVGFVGAFFSIYDLKNNYNLLNSYPLLGEGDQEGAFLFNDLSDGYFYVSNDEGDFSILDISNKSNITFVKTYSGLNISMFAYFEDNFIYDIGENEIIIYDMTDKLNIVEIERYFDSLIIPNEENVFPSVGIDDDLFYLINFEDQLIAIFNISDKSNINLVKSQNLDVINFSVSDTGMYSAYVKNDYIYLLSAFIPTPINSSLVQIINVTDINNINNVDYDFSDYDDCLGFNDFTQGPYAICNLDDVGSLVDI